MFGSKKAKTVLGDIACVRNASSRSTRTIPTGGPDQRQLVDMSNTSRDKRVTLLEDCSIFQYHLVVNDASMRGDVRCPPPTMWGAAVWPTSIGQPLRWMRVVEALHF